MYSKAGQFFSVKDLSLNVQLFNIFFLLTFSSLTIISPTEVQVTRHAQKYLIMNIYMENEKNATSIFNLFDTVNPMYTKLEFGSNKQELIMRIRLDTYSTIINEDKEVAPNFTLYDVNSSKTYSQIEDKNFASKEFSKGILSHDLLTISDKVKIEDFHFFYAEHLNEKGKIPAGIIGLDLKRKHNLYGPKLHKHSINFVDQLHANDIIDEYGVTIILDKENRKRGKLFFGPDLDDIYEEFKHCLKTRVKAGDTTDENFMRWGFMFDKVNVGNHELLGSKNVRLKFDNDFILSTDEYSTLIIDSFFNELIQNKICTMENLTVVYYKYMKCKESVIEKLDKFPVLSFIGTDVNRDPFHLDFTARDLFENIGGTVYFKVILNRPLSKLIVESDDWEIGKIFYRKFVVTLDRRRKTITFYTGTHDPNIYNSINDNIEKKKNSNEGKNIKRSIIEIHSYNISFIMMISLLIIIISIIVFMNIKKLKKNKNKKIEKNSDNDVEMTYCSLED